MEVLFCILLTDHTVLSNCVRSFLVSYASCFGLLCLDLPTELGQDILLFFVLFVSMLDAFLPCLLDGMVWGSMGFLILLFRATHLLHLDLCEWFLGCFPFVPFYSSCILLLICQIIICFGFSWLFLFAV